MMQKNNGLSLIETLLAVFILGSILTVLVVNLNKSLLILLETKYRAYASELGQNCMDEISFDNSAVSWTKFETETIGGLTADDREICSQPHSGSWEITDPAITSLPDNLSYIFQQANPNGFEPTSDPNDKANCLYNDPFLTILYTDGIDPNNVADDIFDSSICNQETSKQITRTFVLDENSDGIVDMTFEVVTQVCFSAKKIKILQTGDDKCAVARDKDGHYKTLEKKIAAVRTTVNWSKTVGAATDNKIEFQRFYVGN